MTRNLITLGLLLAVAILTRAVVIAENERYALQTGMCRSEGSMRIDPYCLRTVETRTSWLWHVFYAVAR